MLTYREDQHSCQTQTIFKFQASDFKKQKKNAKTELIPAMRLIEAELVSLGSRKRRPSLKQASNNEKATPNARKRVKNVPVRPLSPPSNPPSSSESDVSPTAPKPPVDTSTFTFELNVDTVFGSTSVYADGFVLKLGVFNYREHIITAIKKVADTATLHRKLHKPVLTRHAAPGSVPPPFVASN
jgi:hypothetical protein